MKELKRSKNKISESTTRCDDLTEFIIKKKIFEIFFR